MRRFRFFVKMVYYYTIGNDKSTEPFPVFFGDCFGVWCADLNVRLPKTLQYIAAFGC